MSELRYIRANTDKIVVKCTCGKTFYKSSPGQIVYFCSPDCRKMFRKGK